MIFSWGAMMEREGDSIGDGGGGYFLELGLSLRHCG